MGLASVTIILSIALFLNINLDLQVLAIAYLLPLMVYSYDYYKDLEKDVATNPERAEHVSRGLKTYPIKLAASGALLILLLVVSMNIKLILFMLILVAAGALYGKFKSLTKIVVGFKNVYTALIWASFGAFLLLFYYSMDFSLVFVLLFMLVFLKTLLNIIFFDLKDIEADRENGIKTVPVLIGKDSTLKLLQYLNILAFLPLIAGVVLGLLPVYSLIMLLFWAYDYYYLKNAEDIDGKGLRTTSCMMADIEFVIWPVLVFVGIAVLNLVNTVAIL
jgi:4-hydroxybenzoate polyprenyltransferase